MAMLRISFLIGLVLASTFGRAVAQQETTINDKDISVSDYEDLNYPNIAVISHIQGVVVVRVKLDDHGRVLDAVALSGASLLTGPSVENAKKWRFEPNSKKGAVIVYNFRIEGACHYHRPSSLMIFYPPNFVEITACPSPPQP